MAKKSIIKKKHVLILVIVTTVLVLMAYIYKNGGRITPNNKANIVKNTSISEQINKNTSYTTFENKLFSMQLPEGWYTWKSETDGQPTIHIFNVPQDSDEYVGITVVMTDSTNNEISDEDLFADFEKEEYKKNNLYYKKYSEYTENLPYFLSIYKISEVNSNENLELSIEYKISAENLAKLNELKDSYQPIIDHVIDSVELK